MHGTFRSEWEFMGNGAVPAVRVVQAMAWLFALVIALFAGGVAHAADTSVDNCHVGAYRLTDGSVLDVGPDDGAHLRWRREDGNTGLLTSHADGIWTSTLGWTDRSDGIEVTFSDCAQGRIDFAGVRGQRIAFDVTNTRFQGAGVTLAGRLVLPKGKARVPIVVLVHGSEHISALDFYSLQRMFPAAGIGVFVYDKRGTGASGGMYTQSYLLLANDAIAAVGEAKRLAGARAGRIGYQAGSQGGWVAPLAAKISPVDFVIVGFGLAVSPLDEDREAIAYDMQRQGYGPEVMAKAMRVADTSAAILLGNFRDGYDKLDALKKQYGNEPWFKHVHGDVTWVLLAWPAEKLKQKGPELFAGVPLQYDPMPVLRNLDTPQLWILGGEDADAPSAETIRRLRSLQQAGRPISLAVFPDTEHGIYEFETRPDGTRVDTRNPEGYFDMMRDFILSGRLHGGYGHAVLHVTQSAPRRG
jgi:pimeloyl-ACP methyl ester carboxylesterase